MCSFKLIAKTIDVIKMLWDLWKFNLPPMDSGEKRCEVSISKLFFSSCFYIWKEGETKVNSRWRIGKTAADQHGVQSWSNVQSFPYPAYETSVHPTWGTYDEVNFHNNLTYYHLWPQLPYNLNWAVITYWRGYAVTLFISSSSCRGE